MKPLKTLTAFALFIFGISAYAQTPPATSTTSTPKLNQYDLIGIVSRIRTNSEQMVRDMNGWQGQDVRLGKRQYAILEGDANAAIDVCKAMLLHPANANRLNAATGFRDDVNKMIKSNDALNAFYAQKEGNHGGDNIGTPAGEIISIITTGGAEATRQILGMVAQAHSDNARLLETYKLRDWESIAPPSAPVAQTPSQPRKVTTHKKRHAKPSLTKTTSKPTITKTSK